jgi:hypothetical protein
VPRNICNFDEPKRNKKIRKDEDENIFIDQVLAGSDWMATNG